MLHPLITRRKVGAIPVENVEYQGWYLCLPDGNMHNIGKTLRQAQASFDEWADKLITAKLNYQWWIEYCHGNDGYKLHWSNKNTDFCSLFC